MKEKADVCHSKSIFGCKSHSTPLPKSPIKNQNQEKFDGDSFDTIPSQLQCEILRRLTRSQLLRCRLTCRRIKETIESHFIFNVTLNDVNLSRCWSHGLLLPWSRKVRKKLLNDSDPKTNKMLIRPSSLIVGRLQQKLTANLTLVGNSIRTVEFTQPIAIKNMKKILRECWCAQILRIHSSIFLGSQNSCTRAKTKYSKIEIDVNQLSKLYIILDDETMSDTSPCTIPYWLKINLPPPVESKRYDVCEIQFLPQGLNENLTNVYKTWIVDDEIIDIFSRPDILRKITYFATVTEADLRRIAIKFIPHISIPSSIRYTKVINHPGIYPQLKKYSTGPFNGTTLTYFSTKRKRIFTYSPIHLHSDERSINFPDAARLHQPETA